MKKKDIYEVTLKIIGIIAMYKFIVALIGSAIAFLIFHSISTNINLDFIGGGVTQTNFSIYFVLITVFCGIIGYLLLFKTDKLLSLFRLTESTEATLQIEKKTIYHIAVLLIGFFMLTFSGNELTSSTYFQSEVRTTEQTTTEQPTISQDTAREKRISTSTVTSPRTSTTVNYANIIFLLLSILIIIKSEKLSSILMPKEKTELID